MPNRNDRQPREQFTLVLEAQPSAVPAINRLRKCLKLLGRWYGMKCLDCREVRQGDAPPSQDPDAAGEPAPVE